MSNVALIEWQTTNGNWLKISECANKPAIIKQTMDANMRSNPNYKKLRAIDSVTKQILDMSFK